MNLDGFIRQLDSKGELIRIQERVNPLLEISEITDRISKMPDGGKALLFENTGTGIPVLMNSLGSAKRIGIAFGGRSPENLVKDINQIINIITGSHQGLSSRLKQLPLLGKISRWMPKRSRGRGVCQTCVMEKPNLSLLPVLTCWPHDGGPFITLPLVHTVDPVNGSPNLGMYRMQVYNNTTTGMHWHMHKTGARHFREYQKLGKKMPVAVAIGGDPVYTYCATAPLPDGIDEYLLAGFIRRKKVRMVKCITQDIWVPDDVDFVIEGFVDPSEPLATEGPFGDHTGFYSLADKFPVFHVTALTHRKNPVYPATIVGIPPQEDVWIAWATERLFEPLIKLSMVPELIGFHMPVPGVAHNLVLARIKSEYPGQARKVFHTLWGAGQMMFTKFIVITSGGPDLTKYLELARYVSARVDPARHIEKATGPLDILDHSSRQPAFGGKLGIDATGPEVFDDENGSVIIDSTFLMAFRSHHPEIVDINLDLISQGISVGLISMTKSRPGAVRDLIDEIRLADPLCGIRFWFLFDDFADLRSWQDLVWLAGSNTDAHADISILNPSSGQQHGTMFVDATIKSLEFDGFERPWPNPVTMDRNTIATVDRKWKDYGLGKLISSPSLGYLKMIRSDSAEIIK